MTIKTKKKYKLDHYIKRGDIRLERGIVISKNMMNETPGDYPVYSSSVENEGLFGRFGKFMFDEELITWSVDGGGNLFYRPKHKYSVTNVSGVLRIISNKFDYKYLYYLLDWQHKKQTFNYVEKAHPSVIRQIYELSDISIGEQKTIADILKTIDSTIKNTEKIIKKYQQIKSGMMQDLFYNGIDKNGVIRNKSTHKFKRSSFGLIPIEWDVQLLDTLGERGSGHTPSKSHSEYWNGSIKWISLADTYRLDDLYIQDTEYKISKEGIKNSSAVLHPTGSVLISRDAGIGKSAIMAEPMAVSQHFIVWHCGERLNNHYLYFWLQNDKRTFESIASGSTILTIGLSFFENYRIPFPTSLSEQKRIVDTLMNIEALIRKEIAYLDKINGIKKGLMNDLLTDAIQINHLIEG